MNKDMKSFRLNKSTCMGLESIAEKYDVSQSKIIETLVIMAGCEIFPEIHKSITYIDLESFEWFLKH